MTDDTLSGPHSHYHLQLVDQHLATNDPLFGVRNVVIALVAVAGLLSVAAAWR